jgi:hypothetical protein
VTTDQRTLSAALERRLARLEGIEAIKRLQVEYAHACDDNLDADRIAALFAEDGIWEGGSPPERFVGRAEVRRHFIEARTRVRWTFHLMVGPAIDLDDTGERATGQWYLLEPATFSDPRGSETYWLASSYDMEYLSVGGRWLVKRMTLRPPLRSRCPADWAP